MSTVKIFVGYHKPYQLLKGNLFQPIHLGRAVANQKAKDGTNTANDLQWLKDNMIGDDTGDNISEKNRRYCELTGIYWIWKNYSQIGNPDYIGFMHYRRHFIFDDDVFVKYTPHELHEKTYSKINVGCVYDGYEEHFGIADKMIKKILQNYDAILPLRCDLSKRRIASITDDYTNYIEGTHKKDLSILVNSVRKKYPEYAKILQSRLKSSDKRCFQSFVLRREIFFDYCSFLFDILDDVDNKIDVSKYSVNGKRTIGYLGEILFDTYMFKLVNDKKYRVKELGMTFLAANSLPKPIKNRTAIVQLAYSDYESLEISLANFSKYFDDTTKFFVLQNGRGTYDTERTYRVAKRYEKLFPNNIEVVDDIPPQKPYRALMELFNSKRMDNFDYICKVDDDVFPLDPQWFDRLCSSYEREFSLHGENLAYVTGLVNNNPYGFKQIIDRDSGLAEEYYDKIARTHIAGYPEASTYYVKQHIVDKNTIDDDVCGTIWQLPYISRWLHQKTTLQPEEYVSMCKKWPTEKIYNKRYSINVMLFEKNYWNKIRNDSTKLRDDDEFLSELYCKKMGKYVAADLSNPFVHLFFYSQREENRDLINPIRSVYEERLGLPFPISIQANREIELENRLRYVEDSLIGVRAHLFGEKKGRLKKAIKNNAVARSIWKATPSKVRSGIKRTYRKVKNH